MSKKQNNAHTIRLKRILVALDTSSHSRAALEAAVHLANTLEAEIRGLFVHDSTWYRVSRLPSFSEVREYTGEIRPMAEPEMENQMKLIERRLKAMLQRASERFDISHDLHSTEGVIEDKVLEAAEDADLITLGRAGHSYSKQKKMGNTALRIIEKARKPVLILKEGMQLGNSVAIVYDGSKASQKGLKIALALADKNEGSLFLNVFRNNPEALEEHSEEIENLMDDAPVPVYLHMVEKPEIRQFSEQINSTRSGLLVIPKKQPLISNMSLAVLLNNIHCPLLLMNEE